MKTSTWLAVALMVGAVSSNALANADLAKAKNCNSCHNVDGKLVGPGFKEIAGKYAGQKDAQAKLVIKVMKGGSGVWGPVPMPANGQLSEPDAQILVKWILSLK